MEPSAKLTEKRRFWQQHVHQAQSHSGSLANYAQQQQLNVNTLYYWVSVFKTTKPSCETVGFSAVRVSSSAAQYSLQLPSRLTLQFSVLPDPQWLSDVCRAMDART